MSEEMNEVTSEVEVEVEQAEPTPDTEVEVDIPALVEQAKNPPEQVEEPKAEEEDKKEFDPKRDRVEFDTPEQQAKFNDIYKQMKNSDARNQMLTDMLEKTVERLDSMETRAKSEDSQAAEKLLLDQIMSSNEDGDVEKLTESINELTKFRTDSLKDGLKNEIVQEIVNKNDAKKTQDAQSVIDFMDRKSDSGEYLYPWMQEGHPQFNDFLSKASQVGLELATTNADDPSLVYKVMERVNSEMMSWNSPEEEPKPKTRTPDPMAGSNLTQQHGRNKIKMSPIEMEISKKLGVDPKKYAAHKGR